MTTNNFLNNAPIIINIVQAIVELIQKMGGLTEYGDVPVLEYRNLSEGLYVKTEES